MSFSGSGNVSNENHTENDKMYPPEVILAINSDSQHNIQMIEDSLDSEEMAMTSERSSFNRNTNKVTVENEQPAYLGKLGKNINITCFSPFEHYWCSSTANFVKAEDGFDDSYCYTYLEGNISSSVQIVHNQTLQDIQSSMYLTEDWSQRNLTISTLVLKLSLIHI